MNNMVNYLVESGISLSLMALMYLFLLRKETFFRTNRYFLLSSILFSLLLPLIAIPVYSPEPVTLPEVTVTPYRNLIETVIVSSHRFTGSLERFVVSSQFLINIWMAGVSVMLVLFLARIFQIVLIIRKGKVQHKKGYKIVITSKENSPFSFLNYVFVQKNSDQDPGYHRMLSHELEHVRQGHTVDILILDLLLIFQWFNPLIWLLKRVIRENHEYLVDREVIRSGISPEAYKELLLSQVSGNQVYIASHFNYSLLKNRFKMMTRITSPRIAGIKTIAGILLALVLTVVFACEQKKSTKEMPEKKAEALSLQAKNGKIMISGSQEEINKVSELLRSGNFEVSVEAGSGNVSSVILKEKMPITSLTGEPNPSGDTEIYHKVDQMPEYPGGEMALRQFIAENVHYPPIAQEKGMQGKVYVTFVVSYDGTVKNAKIARGVAPSLDAEALRVVNSLPKWKPGMQKGKNVNVAYTVPISFVLN